MDEQKKKQLSAAGRAALRQAGNKAGGYVKAASMGVDAIHGLKKEGVKGAVKELAKNAKGTFSKKQAASDAAEVAGAAKEAKDAADTAKEAADTAKEVKDTAQNAKDLASDAQDTKDAAKDIAGGSDAKDSIGSGADDAKDVKDGGDKDKSGLGSGAEKEDDKSKSNKDKDKDGKDKNPDDDGLGDDGKKKDSLGSGAEKEDDNGVVKKNNDGLIKKAAKGMAVKTATDVGSKLVMQALIRKFLAYLASLIQQAVAAVASFLSMIATAIHNAVMAVIGFIQTIFAVNVILAVIIAVGPVAVVAGSAVIYNQVQKDEVNRRQVDSEINCDELKSTYLTESDSSADIDSNTRMIENAKLCYSAFKAFGMDDDHIAGLFGNIQSESHFDPTELEADYTSVCGISDESYTFGPKKLAIWYGSATTHSRATMNYSGIEEYWGKMKAAYGSTSIYDDAYYIHDLSGKAYHAPGIGLHGFTGGSVDDLMEFCDKSENAGRNWWDLDLQLEYFIRGPENGGYGRSLAKYRDLSIPDAATGARYVFASWEYGNEWGSTYSNWAFGSRDSQASEWRTRIVEWKAGVDYDTAYGESIVAKAAVTLSDGSAAAAARSLTDCNTNNCANGSNANIAEAASSFAWDEESQAIGNNGTELHIRVHEAVCPGDPYYRSCDRTVCEAVRWSGTDDNYPMSICVKDYLLTSDRWDRVTYSSEDDLQPGDVCTSSSLGHTWVYVGHEAILAKHASLTNTNYNIVEGSLTNSGDPNDSANQSPHCDYYDFNSDKSVYVFRANKTEEDSKYKNAVDNFSFGKSSKLNCKKGAEGEFTWPLEGAPSSYWVTSKVGSNEAGIHDNGHNGTDIGATTGTDILAAMSGTVVYAGDTGDGYGNRVVIDHGDGIGTLYGHMSRTTATAGSSVNAGDKIGEVGSTGHSTGPHLHFECRKEFSELSSMSDWFSGTVYDPLKYDIKDHPTFSQAIVESVSYASDI